MSQADTTPRRLCTLLVLGTVLAALLALPAVGRAVTFEKYPLPTSAADASQIVAGPDGALWFTETNANKIGRITTSGKISEIPVPNDTPGTSDSGPTKIVASGGALWFLTDLGESVYRLTTSGTLTELAQGNAVVSGYAIAPSDDGGVWVMTTDNGELVRVSPSGTTTPFPASYANTLFGIAEAPDGSVWFNNGGSDLYRLTDAGATTAIPLSSAGGDQVSSIAFDKRGHAWFTEYAPPGEFTAACCGEIGEVTGGAGHITPIGEQRSGVGVAPHSMTLGPDGDMYFAFDQANPYDTSSFNGIGRVNPTTGKIQVVNISPYVANDIAFGSDGDLWFIDDRENLIGRASVSALFSGAKSNGGGGGGGMGSTISLKLPAVRIASLRRTGVANVGCKLAGAGRCMVTAAISAQAARKLGLKPKRHAKTVSVGSGSALAHHAGRVTIKLRFNKKFLHSLAHVGRSVRVTITGRSTAAGHKPATVKRTLTLRR